MMTQKNSRPSSYYIVYNNTMGMWMRWGAGQLNAGISNNPAQMAEMKHYPYVIFTENIDQAAHFSTENRARRHCIKFANVIDSSYELQVHKYTPVYEKLVWCFDYNVKDE